MSDINLALLAATALPCLAVLAWAIRGQSRLRWLREVNAAVREENDRLRNRLGEGR